MTALLFGAVLFGACLVGAVVFVMLGNRAVEAGWCRAGREVVAAAERILQEATK